MLFIVVMPNLQQLYGKNTIAILALIH